MKKQLLILITAPLLLSSLAIAGGISGPASFPSAKVLPKNIRNFQYNGVYAQGNNKFDNNGKTTELGSSFESTVTYQDLVNGEETLQDQIFAEAKILDAGLGLDQAMGSINGKVNIAINAHAPVFAYGISKKWTMAMLVPIIQSDLNVDTGSIANDSLQKTADTYAGPGQGFKDKLLTVQEKFNNAVTNKLRDNGYDKLEDNRKTQLGDIQLISKYNFYDKNSYRVTMLNSVTLPTGKKSDVDKLIDIGSGDEQWDIGAGIAIDKAVTDRLTLSASFNYIVQLEQTGEERIQKESDKSITDQIDKETKRDLGDILQLATAAKYKSGDTLTFLTSYSFQKKEKDVYRGSKYDASNYAFMSSDTNQELHAIQVGVTFDTITLYRKKQFMAPMEMGLNYTKPIAGKNVLTDSLISANVSLYF